MVKFLFCFYFLIPIKYCFISSGVFPFVSGTMSKTKNIPAAQIEPNKKYKPDACISSSTFGPNLLTTNAHAQLNNAARDDMTPCASLGNNSALTVQGIGP